MPFMALPFLLNSHTGVIQMFTLKNNKARYRVVDRKRFTMASAVIATLAVALICLATMGVQVVYATVTHPEEEVQAVEVQPATYVFEAGRSTRVMALDEDVFVEELKAQLTTVTEKADELNDKYYTSNYEKSYYESKYKEVQDKYNSLVTENKKKEANVSLEKEYGYVLNYPTSDFTIDDIKMIISITKEAGGVVNPHLWFSLVELESGYNSKAKSKSSSASGWGQVIKGTAKWIYEDSLHLGTYNHSTMGTDKRINATISINYLSDLVKEYGVQKALIRYNGGELGQKYANIVSTKLEKNSSLTLNKVAITAPQLN
jgi:hypothetical protein